MHQRFKALTLYLHSLGKVNLNCDLINKNTIFSFNHVEFLINDLFFKGFLAGKVSEGAGLSGTLICMTSENIPFVFSDVTGRFLFENKNICVAVSFPSQYTLDSHVEYFSWNTYNSILIDVSTHQLAAFCICESSQHAKTITLKIFVTTARTILLAQEFLEYMIVDERYGYWELWCNFIVHIFCGPRWIKLWHCLEQIKIQQHL